MRQRFLVSLLIALLVASSAAVLLAASPPVKVYTTQRSFEAKVDPVTVPIPTSDIAPPDPPCYMELSMAFGSNVLNVQNLLYGNGLCIFNEGRILPPGNTNPSEMIANTIVGGSEDDYLLTFTEPVNAVGLRLLTNYVANETVTLFDLQDEVIAVVKLDRLTEPNTRQFVGFVSKVPIAKVEIDTVGGAQQNEGIDLIQVGTR